jgi:hypothetical protein
MTFLWPNMDSYIKSELLADLGPNSNIYSTLRLAEVTIAQEVVLSHLTTPSLVIDSHEAFPVFGSHGDGTVKTDSRYPYLLIVFDRVQDTTTAGRLSVDSYAVLKANMQEHLRRLIEWLAAHWGLRGVAESSDGESIAKMTIEDKGVAIELWGPEAGTSVGGPPASYFWGLAAVPFSIETTGT